MRAAGLIAIETLLQSQAVLIHSNTPNPANVDLIKLVTSRIEGVIAASKYVLCNYNIPRARVHDATKITPGRRAATVSPLDDPEWVAVSSMFVFPPFSCTFVSQRPMLTPGSACRVLKAEVADVMDRLQVRNYPLLLSCLVLTDPLAGYWCIRHPQHWPLQLPSVRPSTLCTLPCCPANLLRDINR